MVANVGVLKCEDLDKSIDEAIDVMETMPVLLVWEATKNALSRQIIHAKLEFVINHQFSDSVFGMLTDIGEGAEE